MCKWKFNYDELSSILTNAANGKYSEVFYIDGRRCDTMLNFYKEFAREIRFPDYFGWNADAYIECMVDTDSYEPPVLCIINHVNSILASDEKKQKFIFSVLDGVAKCSEDNCNTIDIIGII